MSQKQFIESNYWIPVEVKLETDEDVEKTDFNIGLSNEEDNIELEDFKPPLEQLQANLSSPYFMNTICRLCGTQLNMDECIQSVNDVFNCNYPTKILKCTSLQVKRGDLLPRRICSECVANLNNAYSFRNVCLQTYRRLIRDYPTHSKIPPTKVTPQESLKTDGDTEMNTIIQIEKSCDDITSRDDDDTNVRHSDNRQDVTETEFVDIKMAQPILNLNYPTKSRRNINTAKKDITNYVNEGGTEVLCPYCPVIFDMELYNGYYEVLLHLDSHLPVKTFYECRYDRCNVCFTSPKTRKNHERMDHHTQKLVPDVIFCDRCGNVFRAANNQHPCYKPNNENVYFFCDLCSFRSKCKYVLTKHITGAHYSKHVNCRVCNIRILHNKLKHHMRDAHEAKVPCSHCNKEFWRRNIKGHMRTHTGEKPFSCVDCQQQFTFRVSLKAHRKRYHNDDMFQNTTDVESTLKYI